MGRRSLAGLAPRSDTRRRPSSRSGFVRYSLRLVGCHIQPVPHSRSSAYRPAFLTSETPWHTLYPSGIEHGRRCSRLSSSLTSPPSRARVPRECGRGDRRVGWRITRGTVGQEPLPAAPCTDCRRVAAYASFRPDPGVLLSRSIFGIGINFRASGLGDEQGSA